MLPPAFSFPLNLQTTYILNSNGKKSRSDSIDNTASRSSYGDNLFRRHKKVQDESTKDCRKLAIFAPVVLKEGVGAVAERRKNPQDPRNYSKSFMVVELLSEDFTVDENYCDLRYAEVKVIDKDENFKKLQFGNPELNASNSSSCVLTVSSKTIDDMKGAMVNDLQKMGFGKGDKLKVYGAVIVDGYILNTSLIEPWSTQK